MSDDDEDQPEEILGKRGKKGQKNKPLPETPDEIEALIRRQKRNLRKAWAEGYLTAITAMLKPGDLAVDCGANMGVVTQRLATTGADVVAFEPDPFAFKTLEQKFANLPNVTLINAAVGVGSGTVRLMRADNFGDNPEGASVKSTILDGGRRIDAENAVEVPLIDFPSWVADQVKARGEVAFIKMDIEGAELDILEKMDAEQLFQNVRCLVAETHERKFKDLRDRYKALRDKVSESYAPGKVNLDWI
jgi:FkbM family methyltransferase